MDPKPAWNPARALLARSPPLVVARTSEATPQDVLQRVEHTCFVIRAQNPRERFVCDQAPGSQRHAALSVRWGSVRAGSLIVNVAPSPGALLH